MTLFNLPRSTRSLIALVALPVAALSAQTPAPVDTSRSHQTLFTGNDALLAAGFVGLTIAMFPADQHIATHLRDQNAPRSSFVDRGAKTFEFVTTPGSFIIGGSLYVYGRVAHHPGIADLGWHGTEAVIVGSAATALLKGLTGRARPFVSSDTNAHDFKFGGGFGDDKRQSFPSGHTTTAFAAAAAVTSEVNRMWPEYTWYVGPVLYTGATLVGISRMYHNNHWASDVVLGAGIGTFAGLKVVRYSHAHPDNFIDRVILRTSLVPDGNGGALAVVTLPAP